MDPDADADIRLVKELLGLDPKRDEFRLLYGSGRRSDEIAMTTRSIQQALGELATGVEVPEQDLVAGRASSRGRVPAEGVNALMRICSDKERPCGRIGMRKFEWLPVIPRDCKRDS